MPSRYGPDRADFLCVRGSASEHLRINTGVLPGFACGLNIGIPTTFGIPDSGNTTGVILNGPGVVRVENWTFIDATCLQPWNLKPGQAGLLVSSGLIGFLIGAAVQA